MGRHAVFVAVFAGVLALGGRAAPDQRGVQPVVFTVRIAGVVDLGLVPLVERALQTASQEKAAALILDVDTLGGRLDAAIAVRDRLLRSPVQTIAFVNMRAISAGDVSESRRSVSAARYVSVWVLTQSAYSLPELASPSERRWHLVGHFRNASKSSGVVVMPEAYSRPCVCSPCFAPANSAVRGPTSHGTALAAP